MNKGSKDKKAHKEPSPIPSPPCYHQELTRGTNAAEEHNILKASRPREANLDRHLGEQKYASNTLFAKSLICKQN